MASKKKTQPKAAKPDPIQAWRLTAKRESYDELAFDWPKRILDANPALVLRPVQNAVLPKPISIEVLGPASVLRKVRKETLAELVCVVLSTDKK